MEQVEPRDEGDRQLSSCENSPAPDGGAVTGAGAGRTRLEEVTELCGGARGRDGVERGTAALRGVTDMMDTIRRCETVWRAGALCWVMSQAVTVIWQAATTEQQSLAQGMFRDELLLVSISRVMPLVYGVCVQ